ncbi:CCT motif family protein [Euphorbia peplus]|nr:CCT motif family protein [Euphorbia peplus]
MASIPHFYSNYQFSSDEFSDITSVIGGGGGGAFSGNDFNSSNGGLMLGHPSIFYDNNGSGGEFEGYRSESEMFARVPVSFGCFSDQFGVVPDMGAAVPCSSNNSSSYLGYRSGNVAGGGGDCCKVDQNSYSGAGGFQFSDGSSCEYGGDDCCGFVPTFKSVCPELAGDNWGIQCNKMPAIEHNSIKVGRYSVEERKDRILRYLKKRNQRNFNKTIKYACRKTLADRRVRVRGRFARNNELSCEDETEGKNNDNPLQEKESYSNDSLELKNEDDDWLQEAVASLMYAPYIAG